MKGIFNKKIEESMDALLNVISIWKHEGLKIVFTNGCFDLLHRGHIHYLEEAAAQGDRLVVGLNSDASVTELKGNSRPIKNELNRAELLSRLDMVDMVILFEENTPFNLISSVLPDVLVKGGDYTVEQIVGHDVVQNNGGVVKRLGFIKGESSSQIIEKIQGSI